MDSILSILNSIINIIDITFLTHPDFYRKIKDDMVKDIAYSINNSYLCFNYDQFMVYMSLKESYIDDLRLIKSSTPRLLYNQYQTEFLPNTIFYIL
jgi:hypothetical protein